MFRIVMLPADQGDCLWIEYGNAAAPKRMLVDAGVHATAAVLRARIEQLPRSQRVIELAVISHIDLDHIQGMLQLLEDPPDGLVIKDFWFNGYDHLPASPDDTSVLGARMGEQLMERLRSQPQLRKWNGKFRGKAVSVRGMHLPSKGRQLPTFRFAGGMKITVLGPTGHRLERLRGTWEHEIELLGLEPGRAGRALLGHPEDVEDDDTVLGDVRLETVQDLRNLAASVFREDTSRANGSSIVMLAECEGKRVLLAGDAFPSDVLAAVSLLTRHDGQPLRVDAWKLAHHGGDKNTSATLVQAIETDTYLLSTSGSRYEHPRPETIARVLVHRPAVGKARLAFNYRSEETERWQDAHKFARAFAYEPVYPETDGELSVDL